MNTVWVRASLIFKVGVLVAIMTGAQGCRTTSNPGAFSATEPATKLQTSNGITPIYETYRQAIARDDVDDYENAIAHYTAVIASDDNELVRSAVVNRAYMYKLSGQPEKSVADFDTYIELQKAAGGRIVPAVWAGLAHAQFLAGNPAAAQGYLDKAINLADSGKGGIQNNVLLAAFAELYALLGTPKKAIDNCTKIISRLGQSEYVFDVRSSRAIAYIRTGEMDKALDDLDKIAAHFDAMIAEQRKPLYGKAAQGLYVAAMGNFKLRAFAKARLYDRDGAIADLFHARDRASQLSDPLIAAAILKTIRLYRAEDTSSSVVTYEGFGIAEQMSTLSYEIRFKNTIERTRTGPKTVASLTAPKRAGTASVHLTPNK